MRQAILIYLGSRGARVEDIMALTGYTHKSVNTLLTITEGAQYDGLRAQGRRITPVAEEHADEYRKFAKQVGNIKAAEIVMGVTSSD